jgi:hypothetical protein
MNLRKLALAAGLLLLAAPVLAESNEPAADTGTNGGMGHHMTGRPMGHGMWGLWDPKAMVEGRLAYIKTALGITDEQAAAWNSYADASRANSQSMQETRKGMHEKMQNGSALDRMQSRIAMMEARLDALKKIQPATEALYKTLTPEQQKKADHLLSGGFRRI